MQGPDQQNQENQLNQQQQQQGQDPCQQQQQQQQQQQGQPQQVYDGGNIKVTIKTNRQQMVYKSNQGNQDQANKPKSCYGQMSPVKSNQTAPKGNSMYNVQGGKSARKSTSSKQSVKSKQSYYNTPSKARPKTKHSIAQLENMSFDVGWLDVKRREIARKNAQNVKKSKYSTKSKTAKSSKYQNQ